MNKSELRRKYKELRLKLSEEEIEELSLKIANNLLQLKIWDLEFYHLFLSIAEQKEINTEYTLHILQGKDKNVVVSKTDIKKHQLKHFLLTDNTAIKKNSLNIPEPVGGIEIAPKKLDLVFVPLLAFDKNGHRIGYGKGYYDQFLASCKPDVIKIGLSFFEAEEEIKEIYDTDVALDYCVTPNKVYQFKN
ncbi:5-formyltetrahydrofolate cyclo-ligase [Salegentibacter sediminis]|uniref:5-formyltetrahydrofolate cyclo-ligase n=1 Tax=Salegentibacter sediminis TaxID=1930251 RepID=UPI0009BE4D87|nr:5-formyltetrahydrofolate cyclo-ligase [Salegentibacter sediminis]